MRCPDCNREMEENSRTILERFYHWEDEEFYYRDVILTSFRCRYCGIKRTEAGAWVVPKFLKPTAKQVKAISVINSVLGTEFEPVTRYQCCKIISKYMKRSIKQAEADAEYAYMIMDEYLDMSDLF